MQIEMNGAPHFEALLSFHSIKDPVNVPFHGSFNGFDLDMFRPKIKLSAAATGVSFVTLDPSDALRDFLAAAKAL